MENTLKNLNDNKYSEITLKLNSPSKYSLRECLEELKFGRTASDQKLIDKFISQI